jgi:hypothetical protein
MATFISNAFSLSMISNSSSSEEVVIRVKEVTLEEVKNDLYLSNFISAVGHQSTAEVLTTLLEIPISVNRITISLKKGDVLYVFQLLARLPEGQILKTEEIKALPYKFYKVEII